MEPRHLIGIDAAKWQGVLPVSQIVDAGVRFAIVKATHGLGTSPDVQFARSWSALAAAPIVRGAYHWFTDSDPIAQAEHFVRQLVGLRDGDLVAVDFEEPTTKYRGLELLDRLRACLARVEALTGRAPLLYTGAWYWDGYVAVDAPDLVERYPLWHAQYPRVVIRDRRACATDPPALPAPTLPTPWRTRGVAEAIWQFDGDGGCVLPNGVDADFNRVREDVLAWLVGRVGGARDTEPAPAPSSAPQTPTSKSAPRLPRIDAPILGVPDRDTQPAAAPDAGAFARSLADDTPEDAA